MVNNCLVSRVINNDLATASYEYLTGTLSQQGGVLLTTNLKRHICSASFLMLMIGVLLAHAALCGIFRIKSALSKLLRGNFYRSLESYTRGCTVYIYLFIILFLQNLYFIYLFITVFMCLIFYYIE